MFIPAITLANAIDVNFMFGGEENMDNNRKEIREWLDSASQTDFYMMLEEAKLTPRQKAVMIKKFQENKFNYSIAEELNVAPETVRNEIARIYEKCSKVIQAGICTESVLLKDALNLIGQYYYRIFRINLANDSFVTLRETLDDVKLDLQSISNSLRKFAYSDYVYYEDRKRFLEFVDLDRVRRKFDNGSATVERIIYRRKISQDEFRWVLLEIVPSTEYTKANPIVMLYVRDMDDNAVRIYADKQLVEIPDLSYYRAAKEAFNECAKLGVISVHLKPQVKIEEPVYMLLYKVAYIPALQS